MQITKATKEELALLIMGLRAIYVADHSELQARLMSQLEGELSSRFSMVVPHGNAGPLDQVTKQRPDAQQPGEGVNLKYSVETFRQAGLEARWTKTNAGAPIIACREGSSGPWYVIDARLWADIENGGGVLHHFRNATALGEFFSLPA